MKNKHFLAGLAVLLLGTSVALGQSDCLPCEPVCSPKGACSPFTFGGWVESGIYTNSLGSSSNGPMHTASRRRTDFQMSQLYLSAEKEMDTRRGFDWGARSDFVYGTHAGSMQTYDGTFDSGWGLNSHGYALAAYQLYGTLGYKDLSVKAGKFGTPVGWEGSASKDNFFYSHSYCYWIEPATHMGVVADYNLTDRLTVSGGWTTGMDASFANPNGNKAVLAGLTYALADSANAYYYISAGKQNDGEGVYDYFVQSLCFEWAMTKRFTYVVQYNLRNDNARNGAGRSAYGVNNHFLYKLNDKWEVGMRAEWLRNSADFFANDTEDGVEGLPGNYYQLTWGLNWNPCKNVSVRPEVRYDWCEGATPYAGGTKKEQISGGGGVVVSF